MRHYFLTENANLAGLIEGEAAAFRAFCDACEFYRETAFRIIGGPTLDTFKIQGWHIAGGPTRWLAPDPGALDAIASPSIPPAIPFESPDGATLAARNLAIVNNADPDLLWSNAYGWTPDHFDTFNATERETLRLPMGGLWIIAPDPKSDARDDSDLAAASDGFACHGCGRPEHECSVDPCEGVLADRES